MRYLGQSGLGFGSVYIGKGKVLGVDVQNGRYEGNYVNQAGRIRGTVTLSAAQSLQLVTGATIPAGHKISMSIDWPENFANGQPQQLNVSGAAVSVTFEKVGDIP